jgi:hypothetical protein
MANPSSPPADPSRRRSSTTFAGVIAVLALVTTGTVGCNSSDQPDRHSHSLKRAAETPKSPASSPTPEVAEVPDLTGLARADARSALIDAGLRVGTVRKQPSAEPAGTVLRQSVEAGSTLHPGGRVTFVVAAPMPKVPGVLGSSRSSAVALLRARGFRVTLSTKVVNSGRDDVVLTQTPTSGTAVRPGRTVHLVIADYRPPPPPPALASNCTPGYSPCLPPASDYDCAGGSGNGPQYVYGTVQVTGDDIYDLDRDGDGTGCD